jgi:hypothetical protein
MESMGFYWISGFTLLEGHVKVVLANPDEVKTEEGQDRSSTCGAFGRS